MKNINLTKENEIRNLLKYIALRGYQNVCQPTYKSVTLGNDFEFKFVSKSTSKTL